MEDFSVEKINNIDSINRVFQKLILNLFFKLVELNLFSRLSLMLKLMNKPTISKAREKCCLFNKAIHDFLIKCYKFLHINYV